MVLSTTRSGGLTPTSLIKEKTMEKYLILKDTVANKQNVKAGEVVELDVDEGRALVSYNKAELHVAKPKAKKVDRSVGLKTSDVKAPKKRAAK